MTADTLAEMSQEDKNDARTRGENVSKQVCLSQLKLSYADVVKGLTGS